MTRSRDPNTGCSMTMIMINKTNNNMNNKMTNNKNNGELHLEKEETGKKIPVIIYLLYAAVTVFLLVYIVLYH